MKLTAINQKVFNILVNILHWKLSNIILKNILINLN
jgi:hypothetical protein